MLLLLLLLAFLPSCQATNSFLMLLLLRLLLLALCCGILIPSLPCRRARVARCSSKHTGVITILLLHWLPRRLPLVLLLL